MFDKLIRGLCIQSLACAAYSVGSSLLVLHRHIIDYRIPSEGRLTRLAYSVIFTASKLSELAILIALYLEIRKGEVEYFLAKAYLFCNGFAEEHLLGISSVQGSSVLWDAERFVGRTILWWLPEILHENDWILPFLWILRLRDKNFMATALWLTWKPMAIDQRKGKWFYFLCSIVRLVCGVTIHSLSIGYTSKVASRGLLLMANVAFDSIPFGWMSVRHMEMVIWELIMNLFKSEAGDVVGGVGLIDRKKVSSEGVSIRSQTPSKSYELGELEQHLNDSRVV